MLLSNLQSTATIYNVVSVSVNFHSFNVECSSTEVNIIGTSEDMWTNLLNRDFVKSNVQIRA